MMDKTYKWGDSRKLIHSLSVLKLSRILLIVFSIAFILLSILVGLFQLDIEIISFFLVLSYISLSVFFALPFFFKSTEKALLAASMLAIFVSPLLVYSIVLFIRLFGSNNLALVADSKTWIGFAGSIIGGCITMFALLFTLRHDEKMRLRDKAFAIMPILKISPKQHENGLLITDKLQIKNITENIASNIEIVRMTSSTFQNDDEHPWLHTSTNSFDEPIDFYKSIQSPLEGKADHTFRFRFPKDDSLSLPFGNACQVVLKYSDILELKTYYTVFYIMYGKSNSNSDGYSVHSSQNNSFDEDSIEMFEYNLTNIPSNK